MNKTHLVQPLCTQPYPPSVAQHKFKRVLAPSCVPTRHIRQPSLRSLNHNGKHVRPDAPPDPPTRRLVLRCRIWSTLHLGALCLVETADAEGEGVAGRGVVRDGEGESVVATWEGNEGRAVESVDILSGGPEGGGTGVRAGRGEKVLEKTKKTD